MIKVDRFYEQECITEMFERGQGPIPWPTHTKLSVLLSKFMDGMQRDEKQEFSRGMVVRVPSTP